MTPANQPAFRPHEQIEYKKSPKSYRIPGCNNRFFFRSVYLHLHVWNHATINSMTNFSSEKKYICCERS